MESWMGIALLSPFVALSVAVGVYLKFGVFHGGDRRPLVSFILGNLIAGVVVGFASILITVLINCSSPSAGNLCGLWGYVIVGPLTFSLAIFVYLFLWVKKGKATK